MTQLRYGRFFFSPNFSRLKVTFLPNWSIYALPLRITIESTPNRILEPRIEKYYRFVAQNYSIYARILHYRPSTLVLAEHTVVIPITMEVSRQSISSDSTVF